MARTRTRRTRKSFGCAGGRARESSSKCHLFPSPSLTWVFVEYQLSIAQERISKNACYEQEKAHCMFSQIYQGPVPEIALKATRPEGQQIGCWRLQIWWAGYLGTARPNGELDSVSRQSSFHVQYLLAVRIAWAYHDKKHRRSKTS